MSTPFKIDGSKLIIGGLNIPPEFCVLCFSHSQQAFHREPLVDHLKINLKNLRDGKAGDYVVVGILPNDDVADAWFKTLTRFRDRPELSDLNYNDLVSPDPS